MPPCVAEERGESNDDDDVAHLTRLESVSITSLLRILHVDRPEHQVRARRQRCLRCVRCGRGTRRSAPRGWPLPVFEIAPTAPVAALRHQSQTRSFLPHVKLTDSIKPDSSYFTDSPATLSSPQLSSAHLPSFHARSAKSACGSSGQTNSTVSPSGNWTVLTWTVVSSPRLSDRSTCHSAGRRASDVPHTAILRIAACTSSSASSTATPAVRSATAQAVNISPASTAAAVTRTHFDAHDDPQTPEAMSIASVSHAVATVLTLGPRQDHVVPKRSTQPWREAHGRRANGTPVRSAQIHSHNVRYQMNQSLRSACGPPTCAGNMLDHAYAAETAPRQLSFVCTGLGAVRSGAPQCLDRPQWWREIMPVWRCIGDPISSRQSNCSVRHRSTWHSAYAMAGALLNGCGRATTEQPGDARVIVDHGTPTGRPLRYRLEFAAVANRLEVLDEAIEDVAARPGESDVYFYYRFQHGRPAINVIQQGDSFRPRHLTRESLRPDQSVLAQRKDPDQYPEITWLGERFASFSTFREWTFGRYASLRRPQPADLPEDRLLADAGNLALVLNQIEHHGGREFHHLLRRFLPQFDRMSTVVSGGQVQFFPARTCARLPHPSDSIVGWNHTFRGDSGRLAHPKPAAVAVPGGARIGPASRCCWPCRGTARRGIYEDATRRNDALGSPSVRPDDRGGDRGDVRKARCRHGPKAPRRCSAWRLASALRTRRSLAHGGTGRQSVSSIKIYVEGGGDGRNGRAALRRGMDASSQSGSDVKGVDVSWITLRKHWREPRLPVDRTIAQSFPCVPELVARRRNRHPVNLCAPCGDTGTSPTARRGRPA